MRHYCIIFILLATPLVKAQTTPPYCLQINNIWSDYLVCDAGIVETHINEESKSYYDFEISNFVPRSQITDSIYNLLIHYIKHEVAQLGSVDYHELGFTIDVQADFEKGEIHSIIVAKTGKVFANAASKSNLTIDWKDIIKIGEDVILVDI